MKKLYSFCFIFFMLIGINMNIAQAQESETTIDEWEAVGIYKTVDNENIAGVAYVYPAEGDGLLNIRELFWYDLNKLGATPPDYDNTITLGGVTETGRYCIACEVDPDYGGVLPDEIYDFYRNDYGDLVLKQAIGAAPYFIKIADLYTDAGTEGPLSGIFCGSIEGVDDYAYICIKATPTSEEVLLYDNVQSDNYPEIGTPVEYSVKKENVFDPATLTSRIDIAVISIQPKQ